MRLGGIGTSDRRRCGGLLAAALLVLLLVSVQSGVAAAAEKPPEPGEGEGQGPAFIKLPPIVLPVFDGNRVTRRAGIVLALELEPGKTAVELEPNRRQLYDAFISDLYAFFDQHSGSDRVIDTTLIKQRLQETSDRILGPGFVHQVLIQQAFERPQG